MASRKKLRKRFFNGDIKWDKLTEDEAKYLNKYMRKLERDMKEGKEASIPTYKEVPCQECSNKTVLIPVNSKVVEGEDGRLYLDSVEDNNLIVSQYWHNQESAKKRVKSRQEKEERDDAVKELKPTKLGED